MKVLMTADTVGGVWTYALDLCRSLEPLGVRVALATMGARPRDEQRARAVALPNVTLHEGRFKLEWMPDPWDDVRRAGEWLLEIESQFRPDVVHLNGYAHGSLPWKSPVLVVGHSCVASWWQAVKGEAAPAEWDRYRAAVRAGLAAADRVVAPSRAMLDALRQHYGPLGVARVIHNGRDASPYRAAPKEPFVLSAGRFWDEAKNLGALERAAPRLAWPLYVAGDRALADAGDAGLTRNVVPLGRLGEAELAGWMARAAIYALPARYEPFGLSVLEAALSGCALVLGDIASLREIWADAAVYVAPNEHAAIVDAITHLIKNPVRRQEMSRRAMERARCYTTERAARQYISEYRALAEAGRLGKVHARSTEPA